MAPSSSAKQLIAVAGAAFLLATSVAFLLAAESRRPQPVHLRLYMHDVMRGPGTTAIHLIHGVGPPGRRTTSSGAPTSATRRRSTTW